MGIINNEKGGCTMRSSTTSMGGSSGGSGSSGRAKGSHVTKHQQLATTGKAEGMCSGGRVKGYAKGGRVKDDGSMSDSGK